MRTWATLGAAMTSLLASTPACCTVSLALAPFCQQKYTLIEGNIVFFTIPVYVKDAAYHIPTTTSDVSYLHSRLLASTCQLPTMIASNVSTELQWRKSFQPQTLFSPKCFGRCVPTSFHVAAQHLQKLLRNSWSEIQVSLIQRLSFVSFEIDNSNKAKESQDSLLVYITVQ